MRIKAEFKDADNDGGSDSDDILVKKDKKSVVESGKEAKIKQSYQRTLNLSTDKDVLQ
jgi:hypothetical protein